MFRQLLLNASHGLRRSFHYVVSGGAVDVNVEKARGKNRVSVINYWASRGDFAMFPRSDLGDDAIFHQQKRMIYTILRRKESSGGDGDHEVRALSDFARIRLQLHA